MRPPQGAYKAGKILGVCPARKPLFIPRSLLPYLQAILLPLPSRQWLGH